jgi:hypothetical protein
MAISLKFFMIKRGLSIDALVEKSGAKSAEELIDYAKTLSVGVTANDEADVRNYFSSIAPTVTVDAQDDKPKRRRTKKSGGTDV